MYGTFYGLLGPQSIMARCVLFKHTSHSLTLYWNCGYCEKRTEAFFFLLLSICIEDATCFSILSYRGKGLSLAAWKACNRPSVWMRVTYGRVRSKRKDDCGENRWRSKAKLVTWFVKIDNMLRLDKFWNVAALLDIKNGGSRDAAGEL